MSYTVLFIIAMAIFAFSVLIAFIIGKRYHLQMGFMAPFYAIFAGLFVATFCLLMPIYYSACAETQLRELQTVLFSIRGTLQVFTVDADSSLVIDNVTESVGAIAKAYAATLSVLFVIAPIFTFGFAISFVKKVVASVKLCLQRGKDFYVFSELNRESIVLASDIRKNHPKAAIVFTDTFYKNEEESYELIGKANEIGAICFKKDLLLVKLNIHSKKKEMFLFLIGKDESENIGQALKLVNMYGSIPHTHLYVFSTQVGNDLFLAHNKNIEMKVRKVNEVRSLINRVLYDQGKVLFDSALPIGGNEKKIHAVIVGLGRFGTEMLKGLVWYCQMDGYQLEIDAYDRHLSAKANFFTQYPELNREATDIDPTIYRIHIHSGIDVETKKFADHIQKMKDITYVFVSCGSDETNARIAVHLRMLFERFAPIPPSEERNPLIYAVVRNPDEATALTDASNSQQQKYGIMCIGDLLSFFSERVIINSDLERIALEAHMGYGKSNESDFWKFDYHYNSSMSAAIHMTAKKHCGIPGINKSVDQWTDEDMETLKKLEHRRWNAYMRTEGYVFDGSTEKNSRNELAKKHRCLVDFPYLPEEVKGNDIQVLKSIARYFQTKNADGVPFDKEVGSANTSFGRKTGKRKSAQHFANKTEK